MTPPAASTIAGRAHTAGRRHGGAAQPVRRPGGLRTARGRRVSGPARPAAARTASAPALAGRPAYAGGAVAAPTFGLRVVRRCAGVQDARFLDRLIRGRLWIGLIAVMLLGLVTLQLSLLSMNSGIGQAIERSAVLERQNAALTQQISRLSAGQRVQDLAAAQGLVMPSVSDVTTLRAGAVRPDVAVRGITQPVPATSAAAGTTTAATTPPATASTPSGTAATTATPPPTADAPAATGSVAPQG